MSILTPGVLGTVIGRVGNMVFYLLHGQIVGRTIGVVENYSDAQLGNQMEFGLTTLLLNPVNKFIKAGFKTTPKAPGHTYHSVAFSLNKKGAMTGTYPDISIDFSKVIFSKGSLPLAMNARVKIAGQNLQFSWDPNLENEENDPLDQVMLVAFFPDTFQALTVLNGSPRTVGAHDIRLPTFKKKMVIEAYMSFISEDRERVSDSLYLGQLIWDKK